MSPSGIGARLIRVSDDRQDTERQIKDCERWREGQGVTATYIFEDKESRLLAERREGFQRLLAHVRDRSVQWVVVQAVDRIGFKDAYELFEFLSLFSKNKVLIFTSRMVPASPGRTTSPSSRISLPGRLPRRNS